MKTWFNQFPVRQILFSSLITLALTFEISPAWAGDPFRNNNPRNIGDLTEAAFEALFRQGNYRQARLHLQEAEQKESNEPLAHTLMASLAYIEEDWSTFKVYATKTLKTAQVLTPTDPVRGNLYTAVGHFLEGTYDFYTDGPLTALTRLQKVFQYLDEAEAQSPNDPELNLIKGYMDVLLAVSLPFSNAEEAIERLDDYAAPKYLVTRGIAIAYRDLKKYDRALQFVEQSLKNTPDNPEIYYLKAQILYKKGRQDKSPSMLKQAIEHFEKALTKAEQLPKSEVKQLHREIKVAKRRLASLH